MCPCGTGCEGTRGHQGCVDNPNGWTSNAGSSCSKFVNLHYCTASGGYGPGWQPGWGTFADYANNGVDATQACCGCGGGTGGGPTPTPPPPTPGCDAGCTIHGEPHSCEDAGCDADCSDEDGETLTCKERLALLVKTGPGSDGPEHSGPSGGSGPPGGEIFCSNYLLRVKHGCPCCFACRDSVACP